MSLFVIQQGKGTALFVGVAVGNKIICRCSGKKKKIELDSLPYNCISNSIILLIAAF
jgi:hypothetical protein